jgi:lipid-binding SYLF domain-containing protein
MVIWFLTGTLSKERSIMNRLVRMFVLVLGCVLCLNPPAVHAQHKETAKVYQSIEVLNEIMSIPEGGIPDSLLRSAYGIVIFPGLLKAGFIVGARYGGGIMVVRSDEHGWSNPVFFTLIGGSIGWQIGAQSTDIILVFRTIRSLDAITSGKFTLGADASVAAGPVGRHASAETDIYFSAEILSYSRSRGLFAGLSVEGAALQVDYDATAQFYGRPAILPMQVFRSYDMQVPTVVDELKKILRSYSGR